MVKKSKKKITTTVKLEQEILLQSFNLVTLLKFLNIGYEFH